MRVRPAALTGLAAVQVATSAPALQAQGYIYNSPDCGTQDDQRSTKELW